MDEVNKKAELLLHKWKTELKNKDRSRINVGPNFDELVGLWHRAEVSFETAFDLFKSAIKAHYPTDGCIRSVYKRLKSVTDKNEKEFKEDWLANIESTAYQSFYSYYTIDVPEEAPKYLGSMSEKEYKLQRAYADSYPEVDLDAIEHEQKLVNIKEL